MRAALAVVVCGALAVAVVGWLLVRGDDDPDRPEAVQRLEAMMEPGCERANGIWEVDRLDPGGDGWRSRVAAWADLDGEQFSAAVDAHATGVVVLGCEVAGAVATYFEWDSRRSMARAVQADTSGRSCALTTESFQGPGPTRLGAACEDLGGRVVRSD